MKADLREIWQAPDRPTAEAASSTIRTRANASTHVTAPWRPRRSWARVRGPAGCLDFAMSGNGITLIANPDGVR